MTQQSEVHMNCLEWQQPLGSALIWGCYRGCRAHANTGTHKSKSHSQHTVAENKYADFRFNQFDNLPLKVCARLCLAPALSCCTKPIIIDFCSMQMSVQRFADISDFPFILFHYHSFHYHEKIVFFLPKENHIIGNELHSNCLATGSCSLAPKTQNDIAYRIQQTLLFKKAKVDSLRWYINKIWILFSSRANFFQVVLSSVCVI